MKLTELTEFERISKSWVTSVCARRVAEFNWFLIIFLLTTLLSSISSCLLATHDTDDIHTGESLIPGHFFSFFWNYLKMIIITIK